MTTPSPDQDETARIDSDPPRPVRRSSASEGQFAPGTVAAGRYRIAGILGSGGMGEVYRAEDIKLDQAVALKFLPARLARDPILLSRLHEEVRLGRQVSHPNVCRTYDIVEADGAHFVAMEYVDGEDLARLLRRIGRLAPDKAIDLARGIAAGLMAAHAKGILHRDLKPANVMIDSHGEARIMDFGLALSAGEDDGTISGTPAYMAPEQLEGTPATVQSDLYALGLVMYELFTGKRAHAARTLPERMRDVTSEVAPPSAAVRVLDPAVERLILRCLANDPAQRPRSAREVVESLPGGDPLAAAMRAGETPSPRLVAAAGTEGSLSRTAAWSLLAAVAALFAVLLYVRSERGLGRYAPPVPSPEVLDDRASGILRTLGVATPGEPIPAFFQNAEYWAWLTKGNRWDALRRGPSLLTYRLEYGVSLQQSETMPRLGSGPARTDVEVDGQGRLTHLIATPPREPRPRPTDWNALLGAAGLHAGALRDAPPRFTPAAPFDTRRAWSGTYPGDRTPIQVQAASWRGLPTFFRVTGPWHEVADPFAGIAFAGAGASAFMILLTAAIVGAGLLLAWRNLRLGRGDRRGARRLAAVTFICAVAGRWLPRLSAGKMREAAELFEDSLAEGLFIAAFMYLLYIALEPFVRRRWPSLLIAWTRLVAGELRNPMVGRDVLIGIIGSLFVAVMTKAMDPVLMLFGRPDKGPDVGRVSSLLGFHFTIAEVLDNAVGGMASSMLGTVLLTLLLLILRKRSLAAGAFCAGVLTMYTLSSEGDWMVLPFVILASLLFTFVVVRYGLLAFVVMQVTVSPLFNAPHISTRWSLPMTAVPYVAIAVLAVWAFRTSLGGQSAIAEGVLGE